MEIKIWRGVRREGVGWSVRSRCPQRLKSELSVVGKSVTTSHLLRPPRATGGRVRSTSCGIISLEKQTCPHAAESCGRQRQDRKKVVILDKYKSIYLFTT